MKPQSDFQPENGIDITPTATLTEDILIGTGRGGLLEVFEGAKVVIKTINGQTLTFENLPEYWQCPVRVYSLAIGTETAAQIVAYY